MNYNKLLKKGLNFILQEKKLKLKLFFDKYKLSKKLNLKLNGKLEKKEKQDALENIEKKFDNI